MTAASAVTNTSIELEGWQPSGRDTRATAVRATGMPYERARLSRRLRRVLTDNPRTSHFTVHHIVKALGSDGAAPPAAFFAAAGIFGTADVVTTSGAVTNALGARMAFGFEEVHLPRSLLRRKIPRSSLALLIHGVASLLDGADSLLRERWTWVFHPFMGAALGLILFLLGLASMTPIIGGGVQHAVSAFFIAVGIAERDGLLAVIGALAGIACLTLAVLSIASGRKLWNRIKAWLLQCARKLRLDALARMLDHCCDGLGDLMRLRWSALLLLMLSPATEIPHRPRVDRSATSVLRTRARRARRLAERAYGRLAVQADES